jgi:parallel beta-helix repeat protein
VKLHKGIGSKVILSFLLVGIVFSVFTALPATLISGASSASQNTVLNLKNTGSKVVKVAERAITSSDVEKLKQIFGTYTEGENYCLQIGSHGTGLRPLTEESWNSIAKEAKIVESISLVTSSSVTSPSSVDLSSSSWFPPIGNQDGEGSCVAWAVGYYVKTFQEAKEHGWNLSEAQWINGYYGYPTVSYQGEIISPSFIYNLINGGVDNGSTFVDAINLVCGIGACSWEKMPYDPTNYTSWPSEDAWREASLYRGNSSTYEILNLETNESLVSLKNWIASGNLAVIGVDGNQYGSLSSNDVWTLGSYVPVEINHANTIVGYDDNFSYHEGGTPCYGAFKIANSWGVGGSWEHVADGFYWISYEAMKQRIQSCWLYSDLIDYTPEILASLRIVHSQRGECDVTIGVGNHLAPTATKSFSILVNGGDHPFCSNNIVFDITEFKNYVTSIYDQTYFTRVYDGGSSATGTIMNFSVLGAVSEDTPVYTKNGAYVYADVSPPGMIKVPSQYATIQEAINAATLGMTIEVSSRTYYENVVVNKTVLLSGENQATTIIDGGGTGNTMIVTADNVTIKGFTITDGINGLTLNQVKNCVISGNKITYSLNGVTLYDCENNVLSNNTIADNTYNFGVEGWKLSHFINSIGSSNTVNGKPILYFVNQKNYTLDTRYSQNTGYLAFVNSTNIIIQNLIAEDNVQGVLLAYTTNSLIQNVTILNNTIGLELLYSSVNMITDDSIVKNSVGIHLGYSSNNTIFHNSFVKNELQALTNASYSNSWDKGYPEGGNHWDDYTGLDEKSGPYQNQTGSDGIGDAPKIIDVDNIDNYPLMNLSADQTPPVTSEDYDGLWHAANFVITLTATDVWTGVAETYYRINNGSIQTVSADGQPRITVGGAQNTLEYWSVDNSGNEELPHKLLKGIKCDDAAPTGSIIINNGSVYTTSASVTLTLNATDVGSGVSQVRYSNDGTWDTEPWVSSSQTMLWNLTSSEGTKTVYFQIKDKVGLMSQNYSATITLDKTAPAIDTLSRTPAGGIQSNQPVTVSANIADATSGVKNVTLYYSVDNSSTSITMPMSQNNLTGLYEAVIPGQQSRTWVRYKITAYDYAGNKVVFDQTEPYRVSSSIPELLVIVAIFLMIPVAIMLFLIKRIKR